MCSSCFTAALRVSGMFSADCRGCEARAVARSPAFRKVRDAGKLSQEYLELLETLKLTHAEVKSAYAADMSNKSS